MYWLAAFLACALVMAAVEIYLLSRDLMALREEYRRLNYTYMSTVTKWQADKQRWVDAYARKRDRLRAMAQRADDLKAGVEEALELLAAYRTHGYVLPHGALDAVRDELSMLGRLDDTEPADLSERAQWGGLS